MICLDSDCIIDFLNGKGDAKLVVSKYFEEIVKINFIEVELKGKYFIDKIIYGLYFGYMLSYFLAQTLGVDYKKIDRIKTLKNKLK